VAQTRRKRQTKHRGNAAGMIVARGRTGRKLAPEERSESARKSAQERAKRAERLNRPPTWQGAFSRAGIAAVAVLLASVFLLHAKTSVALIGFPVVLIIYVPATYFMDLWLYRRRMRRQGAKPLSGRGRS
jgi:Na+/glutamate symporter